MSNYVCVCEYLFLSSSISQLKYVFCPLWIILSKKIILSFYLYISLFGSQSVHIYISVVTTLLFITLVDIPYMSIWFSQTSCLCIVISPSIRLYPSFFSIYLQHSSKYFLPPLCIFPRCVMWRWMEGLGPGQAGGPVAILMGAVLGPVCVGPGRVITPHPSVGVSPVMDSTWR